MNASGLENGLRGDLLRDVALAKCLAIPHKPIESSVGPLGLCTRRVYDIVRRLYFQGCSR